MSEEFRAAVSHAGLDYSGPIIPDGKLHRVNCSGDKKPNSWYVLHAGPPAAGAFGCWKRGIKETWCERNRDLSQSEWDQVRRHWREAEEQREKIEAERRTKAKKTAAWILRKSKPITT